MAARNSRSKGRSLSRKPNDGRKSLPRSSASKKVAKHESISRKSRTSGSKPTSQAKKGATRTANRVESIKTSIDISETAWFFNSASGCSIEEGYNSSRAEKFDSYCYVIVKRSFECTSRTSSSATSLSVASSRSSQSIVKPVLNVRLCINLAGNKEVTIDLPNVLNDPRVVSADASSSGRRNSSKSVSVAQKRRVQTRRAQVVAAS
ncbi:hypothetical protein Ddc_02614 [Ditylenchus destructor]|nr:hypothetical protein Ddc_02614 [Ditylenchus destructor]